MGLLNVVAGLLNVRSSAILLVKHHYAIGTGIFTLLNYSGIGSNSFYLIPYHFTASHLMNFFSKIAILGLLNVGVGTTKCPFVSFIRVTICMEQKWF